MYYAIHWIVIYKVDSVYPLQQQLGPNCYFVWGGLPTYCLSINLPRVLQGRGDDQTSGKSNVEQQQTHVHVHNYIHLQPINNRLCTRLSKRDVVMVTWWFEMKLFVSSQVLDLYVLKMRKSMMILMFL